MVRNVYNEKHTKWYVIIIMNNTGNDYKEQHTTWYVMRHIFAMHVCAYECMWMCACMRLWMYVHLCMHVPTYMCCFVHVCACDSFLQGYWPYGACGWNQELFPAICILHNNTTHCYIYIYIYICIYIYIYTHTNTHICNKHRKACMRTLWYLISLPHENYMRPLVIALSTKHQHVALVSALSTKYQHVAGL